MDDEIKTWLYDIQRSIAEIESYFEGRPKRFEEFSVDAKTKRAVERNIEIIGEAVSRILKKDPEFPLTEAKKIVGTRNRIIHGYDKVTPEILWGIVINHIPVLKQTTAELLSR